MTWKIPPGVIHNMLTPMTDNYEIDEATLRRYVDFHCEQQGSSALCINVNLSDCHNVSFEERKQLAEIIVDQAAGRLGVITSVASSSLDQSIELAGHAEAIGSEAIMAVPPYNWQLSEEDLFEFFVALAESAPKTSLVGYHIPSWQSGAGLNPDMVVRLVERLENFVGIKDASFNLNYYCELQAMISRVRPDFEVSTSLEWFLFSMPMGSHSAHSGISCIAPNLSTALFQSAQEGDWVRAKELFQDFGRLWGVLYAGFPNSLKAAMKIMDRPVGPMRLPHEPLSEELTQTLRANIEALGVIDSEPRGW